MEQCNMEMVKNELSGAATLESCPTCLTYGRAMSPLRDGARAYAMLLAGTPYSVELTNVLMSSMRVCWECGRFLHRILEFQRRALEAHRLLSVSFQHLADHEKLSRSLSTLAPHTNLSYDREIEYQSDSDDDWDAPLVSAAQVKVKQEPAPEPEEPRDRPARKRSARKVVMKKLKTTKKKSVQRKKRTRVVKEIITWPGQRMVVHGPKTHKNFRIVSISMGEEEMLKYRDDDRTGRQFVESMFKCVHCIKGFGHQKALNKHNDMRHNTEIGPYECTVCTMRFTKEEHRLNHQKRHYAKYVCSTCGFTHRFVANVVKHYDMAHHPTKQYPCDQCDKIFESANKRRYHKSVAHKDIYKCEYCGKVLVTPHSLKVHILQHTGMPMVECTLCHKSCRGDAGLYAHMRNFHKETAGEEAYCKECNIQFKSKASYKTHMKRSEKHASPADLKFPCPKCPKRFISQADLNNHDRRYHLDYTCRLCNKKLANWFSLNKHTQYVHEKREMPKKHVCEVCGKAFTSRQQLKHHHVTHTGERPYACDICGSCFSQRSTVRTHKKLIHFKQPRTASAAAALKAAGKPDLFDQYNN